MTVGDICTRDVVVAPKTEVLVQAARRMRTSHAGTLVVVEVHDGRLVPAGIVTHQDIVIGAVAGEPERMLDLLVGDVMSPDVAVAQEGDSVDAALRKMHERGVRRLPIVDRDGVLSGILTFDDVLEYLTAHRSLVVALVAREQKHMRPSRAAATKGDSCLSDAMDGSAITPGGPLPESSA